MQSVRDSAQKLQRQGKWHYEQWLDGFWKVLLWFWFYNWMREQKSPKSLLIMTFFQWHSLIPRPVGSKSLQVGPGKLHCYQAPWRWIFAMLNYRNNAIELSRQSYSVPPNVHKFLGLCYLLGRISGDLHSVHSDDCPASSSVGDRLLSS